MIKLPITDTQRNDTAIFQSNVKIGVVGGITYVYAILSDGTLIAVPAKEQNDE